MGKGHKHVKRLKAEKAKVKLKAKKTNQLPKGLNITDTSFKVKNILIREQLQQRDETEILSISKLNIKDLLMRFQHHNSNVRQEALRQLKEILLRYSPKDLHLHLNSLLRGVVALSLDKEKDIRRTSLNALNLILSPISNEQLTPYHDILISYLSCAMTHIDPYIKEDSLLLLDVLTQNCGSALAKNSHKILPNFLGMICRLHNDTPGKQLTTTFNSKNTSVKWRIKVLERLANIFISLVYHEKHCRSISLNKYLKTVEKKYTRYVPIYGSRPTQVGEVDFDKDPNSILNCTEEFVLSIEEFVKYIGLLMPLIFDIWLEVCPDEKTVNNIETTISNEIDTLLTNIVKIIESIIEYIDMLEYIDHETKYIKHWFRDTFYNMYTKNFMSRFPYSKRKQLNNSKKHQEDFSQVEITEKCLQQNLALCQIQVWFISTMNRNKKFSKTTRDYCESVLCYLNGVIVISHNSSALSQLTKLLRTLFLKAGSILNANDIDLINILKLILKASSCLSKEETQSYILILGDIMLEDNLNELHRQSVFKSFVATLSNLLLEPSIDDAILKMINQIVSRFKEWIQEDFTAKQEAIIENAKKINIVGSSDEKQSRLMICNLFYFIDSEIYY